jgi:hypothetical protein
MMYCMKCKNKTESVDIKKVTTKNNRTMLKGICVICGKQKATFVPIKSGTGVLNNLVNNLPVEVHMFAEKGENVPGGSFNNQQNYSYAGPGTKYVQRAREGYQGINELDKMAKLHDQFYNENVDTQTRNISDVALAHRRNEIANDPKTDEAQRRDAKLVKTLMENKARFGLGLKNKSKN